jgi:hypothetical protein
MGIGESLEHTSGEFNLTTYIQSLQFKLRCYEGSGNDFQRLFEDIMERARPGFMRIRAYGDIGDRKCDGFLPADGTLSVNSWKILKMMKDLSTSNFFIPHKKLY